MPWSVRVLRAFLGGTFLFAGAQKVLDPNFLNGASETYVGRQLDGFANGSPIAPIMTLLGRFPMITGIGIALTEIAVGVAILLGVAMLTASAVGFSINAALWLSATWHVHPYFLGSDSIYAVAWIALAAGVIEAERRKSGSSHIAGPIERIDGLGRREFVRGGLVAGVTVAVATVSKAFAGPATSGSSASGIGRPTPTRSMGGASPAGSPAQGPSGSASNGNATANPGPSVRGTVLTTLSRLTVGKAIGFTAAGGVPAVLMRLSNDQVLAYSRICTHAGCTVGYDPSAQLLVCPCHGAEFDPAHGAAVVAGPTNAPLRSIKVVVSNGKVILPSQA